MLRNAFLSVLFLLLLPAAARAFEECRFAFELNTQSSALQSLIDEASSRGGFWRPITEAPDDVQGIARFIGRLDVCLRTVDGKPRTVRLNGGSLELQTPHVSYCTAALLPGNRLLTNRHCFYEPTLVAAGFTVVDQVRINFGYTSSDFTQNVRTFLVANREIAASPAHDALVLQIVGGDANAVLGGHVPMLMETGTTPRRALTMIHHPGGGPQQFSAGTCQIDSRQAEIPPDVSLLRHRCESASGSSGALLLDARTLAVVGLHNTGGLDGPSGYNSGHKIEMIEAALGLGFAAVLAPPSSVAAPPPTLPAAAPPAADEAANSALFDALLEPDADRRRDLLAAVIADHPGSTAAARARAALDRLAGQAPDIKVLSVRAEGGGDYRTIADAVAAAAPGTRIEIHPGIYDGGVDIDKPLDLVGIGNRADIIWEAAGDDVIYWTAPSGRIANLTLRQTGGNFYGVDFAGGSAVLEDCDLTSQGLAVVASRNGANPAIRRNTIHDGATSGVLLYDGGTGTIEENEIFGHASPGITVEGESDPVIRKNIVRDGGQSGILVKGAATGTIEANEIFGNGFAGLEITGGANPVVRDNIIRDGKESGIYVHTGGLGVITRNEILRNGYAGITIEDSDPVIRGNVIGDGAESGIFVKDNGRGTIEQNEIFGNGYAGIEIKTGANPFIVGNVISRNVYEAIWIYEDGRGRIKDNDLRGNKGGAFDIEDSAGKVGLQNNTE